MIIDLNNFTRNSKFYGCLDVLVTIKSFDVGAIRKRYIESRKNKNNRSGAVERRNMSEGGIAAIEIERGTAQVKRLIRGLDEPRGIAQSETLTAFALENQVLIYGNRAQLRTITNPWFSYIHSLDFRAGHILIASSGFDAVFEYELQNFEKTAEWFAWDQGMNESRDPQSDKRLFLCRNENQANELVSSGKEVLLITDPKNQTLPTAKRAAFINSVSYKHTDSGKIIATLFHEGCLIEIDLNSKEFKMVLEDLKNPHGGFYQKKYMATSTGSGEFVIDDMRFIFKNLPNKAQGLEEMEWIQNTIPLNDNLFLSIDSNRSSFVLFDICENLFDLVPFHPDWAVQDLILNKNEFNLERLHGEDK